MEREEEEGISEKSSKESSVLWVWNEFPSFLMDPLEAGQHLLTKGDSGLAEVRCF